ncbi:MAG: thioredoxin, partial [Thermoplasmata archaeon]
MGVRSINESAFQKEVIESNIPVVVDFSATWCGPCRALEPNLEALSKEYEGKVKFVRVDVDENQELAVQYGIRSVPTLLLFKNGE